MDITEFLKNKIVAKRKAATKTLKEVADASGVDKDGKVNISTSALSAIENGKLKRIKNETFDLIAEILEMDERSTDFPLHLETSKGVRKLKIAFGPCCWATPLINAIVKTPTKIYQVGTNESSAEELKFNNLELICYRDASNNPVPLTKYNQEIETNFILTANETFAMLKAGTADIAFLPVLTAKYRNIIRIARCMNTVKGGVYFFVIGKKSKRGEKVEPLEHDFYTSFDHEIFNEIKRHINDPKNSKTCKFVYPPGTMPEILINNRKAQFNDDKDEVAITTIEALVTDVNGKVEEFFRDCNAKYFVFAGWDVHISALMAEYNKGKKIRCLIGGEKEQEHILLGKFFDAYLFTEVGHPFPLISYDCVCLSENSENIKSHPGLKELLLILSENVKALNEIKHTGSPKYTYVSNFLGTEKEFTVRVLDRINWEFLIYPEMIDANLK